jgi:hypothetical protein
MATSLINDRHLDGSSPAGCREHALHKFEQTVQLALPWVQQARSKSISAVHTSGMPDSLLQITVEAHEFISCNESE